MTSLYQEFAERWAEGCGAEICPKARNLCLARGKVPCDVLFVGEAPGESEDTIGRPFVGPAGKLLDSIVDRALGGRIEQGLAVAYTNLVCCIPREEDGGKAAEPDDESVEACKSRLQEFVRLCDGEGERLKLIVCVGSMARDWLEPGYRYSITFHREIPRLDITHPAAILRANVAQRGLAVQRAVVSVQSAVENLL